MFQFPFQSIALIHKFLPFGQIFYDNNIFNLKTKISEAKNIMSQPLLGQWSSEVYRVHFPDSYIEVKANEKF